MHNLIAVLYNLPICFSHIDKTTASGKFQVIIIRSAVNHKPILLVFSCHEH